MAKLKKTARKKTASASAQAQSDLSKTLSESAQQIWLAGVGAFARAQAEGTKLFEGLVKEGLNLEQTARKIAGNRADVARLRVALVALVAAVAVRRVGEPPTRRSSA